MSGKEKKKQEGEFKKCPILWQIGHITIKNDILPIKGSTARGTAGNVMLRMLQAFDKTNTKHLFFCSCRSCKRK